MTYEEARLKNAKEFAEAGSKIIDRTGRFEMQSIMNAATQFEQAAKELRELVGFKTAQSIYKVNHES